MDGLCELCRNEYMKLRSQGDFSEIAKRNEKEKSKKVNDGSIFGQVNRYHWE